MNTKNRAIGTLVSAGTTVTMLIGLGVGVAHADPIATPTSRVLAISGSDTTDEVMQALAEDGAALALGGTKQVENWGALSGGNVAPHGGTTCTIARPSGSGAGRTALLNSIGTPASTAGCFQGARSSSLTLDAVPAGKELVYVPFAREAVTFAVTNTSSILRNQTFTRIQQFYRCQNSSGTTVANPSTKVMLPQSNSGTRKFWLLTLFGAENGAGQLGATIAGNTATGAITSGCVENGADEFGATIQEHQGGQVGDNEMVPYSVGQWTSQASGVIGENRGRTILAQINGTNPYSTGAFVQRALYNVFPTTYITAGSTEATAARSLFMDTTAGSGNSAQICTNAAATAIVSRFGLFPDPSCGNTSQQTPSS